MQNSRLRRLIAAMVGDRAMLCALLLLLLLAVVSIAAPWITSHDPGQLMPRMRLRASSVEHLMGTDSFGRDVFSRVIHGGRLSIVLASMVCAVSIVIGMALGLIAGYARSLDAVIMRTMDGVMAMPGLLLAVALVALTGASLMTMVMAISVPEIPRIARLVRGVVLSVREEAFVEASVGLGTPRRIVVLRHIVPSTVNPLVVQGTFVFAAAILTEAALGFLGLGFPPEIPSLGSIIAEGRPYFERAPWIVLCPGAFLALLILGVNILGDALRDRLDPRLGRTTKA